MKRVIGKQYSTRSDAAECGMIRVTAACKQFSHFSLGVSESHSLTYLKLKLDYSNLVFSVVSLFSLNWVIIII